jgi:hypothetical protein
MACLICVLVYRNIITVIYVVIIVLFVETPRKFITANLSIHKPRSIYTIYFIAMQTYKELMLLLL